jgi:OOP family OmpA-OmpF porin
MRRWIMSSAICSVAAFSCLENGAAQSAGPTAEAKGSDTGIYLGANYGFYKARGGTFDDDNDLPEAAIGINLSRYFAIEASAIDFGRIGGRLIEAEADGWTGSLALRYPLTETLGIYARGGVLFWDVTLRRSGDTEDAIDDSDIFYGVGFDFRISRMLKFIAEYVRYEIDFDESALRVETDIDAAKVGLRLIF